VIGVVLFDCVVDLRQDLLEFGQVVNDFELVFALFVELSFYLMGLIDLFDCH
jgi:hypothetical protein